MQDRGAEVHSDLLQATTCTRINSSNAIAYAVRARILQASACTVARSVVTASIQENFACLL